MASKKGGASGKGKNVRRFDKNGNPYFVNRETGRRVSREKWQRERDRIKTQRERARAPVAPSRPVPPPAPPPVPPPAPPPPFPPGVDDTGWPMDEDGEWDLDAFAVEGEDDT